MGNVKKDQVDLNKKKIQKKLDFAWDQNWAIGINSDRVMAIPRFVYEGHVWL
jgi:hypothetical protein